jgi:hypothetical protein
MIRKSIFVIGMSLSAIALYSCKDSNKTSDVSKSEKTKSYIKVSMGSKDGTVVSRSSTPVSTYSFHVTVKCTNAYEGNLASNESYTITNTELGIPVVADKDCDLEFNHFNDGLGESNVKFIPSESTANTKLILSYDKNGQILKRNNSGHYVDETTTNINKYVNGSKDIGMGTTLNLYVSSSPDQQTGITPDNVNNEIPTTQAAVNLTNLTAPKAFPLKITKTNDRISGIATSNYRYKFSNTESPAKTSWPNNCRIISIDHLTTPTNWFSVDKAYKDTTNSNECTPTISLTGNTNWTSRKGKIQYIILATGATATDIQNAYTVITIPAM